MTVFKADYSKMNADQLRAKIAELEAAKVGRLTLKVQTVKKDKEGKVLPGVAGSGAVSLYGLGRFPVTLYASQWQRLAGYMGEVTAFIEANKAIVAVRD